MKCWLDSQESYQGERLYTLIHLMTVFWLPFLVIFCAYVYIVVYLFYYSLRPYQNGLVDAPIKESWSFVSRPTTTGHDAVHQAEE
jgi:hypothetical protein